MDNITWVSRYSETDLPDKHGRWGRYCYYKNLHIGIVKITVDKKYVLITHFPVNSNDIPTYHQVFDTFEEAKVCLLSLWGTFLSDIK